MPLTKIECDRAACPPDRKSIKLADGFGMYLEVTAAGGKYWRWKYRHAGVEKRLALGVYPAVTLAEAREARDQARKTLATGSDPSANKKASKAAQVLIDANTFEKVARAWHEHWKANKSTRHADYVLTRLEADVFPMLGGLPISSITAPQFLAMAKKIEKRGAMDIAKRAFQTCGQIMRYAVAHGFHDRNPCADVRPSDALKPTVKGHYARLDAKELPQLLRKIEGYQGTSLTRLAMKLMALTFVRTGELIGARWEEFDLKAKEWRIPAERMKMRTPHIVPLAPQTIEVMEVLQTISGHREYVFPGERNPRGHMSNGAILGALKRMGYTGRMTGHGFRGIASTILHEHGHPHHCIELQLAHQERNEVSAAYNFATYLEPRRAMMNAWANHLDKLRRGADVHPMETTKAA